MPKSGGGVKHACPPLLQLRNFVRENDAGALEACESLLEQAPAALREQLRGVHAALGKYDLDAAGVVLDAQLS